MEETKIRKEIRKAVLSKEYKRFKFLYQHGIIDLEAFKKAETKLNRALTKTQSIGNDGNFLSVDYEKNLVKTLSLI